MRCVPALVMLGCLGAAEPDLTLRADLAALRTEAPTTTLTAAWAGDPAWVVLRQRLEEMRRVEATFPPVLAVLDAATTLALERRGAAWSAAAPGAGAPWTTWMTGRTEAPVPAEGPLVAWTWNARETLARCGRLGFEIPLTDWRSAEVALAGTWRQEEGTWVATTRLTTTAGLPLAPAEVGAVDGTALVAVATTVDPRLLATVFARNLHPAHRRFVEDRLGRPLVALADILDGRVLLRVEAGTLLPTFLLSLGLHPGQTPEALVVALGDSFRGQATTLAGASRAVRLETPLGPWFAACSATRLVIGTDPSQLTAALAPSTETPSDLLLKAHADLPALVRRFLPLALAGWSGTPLIEDPLPSLLVQVEDLAVAQIQAEGTLVQGLTPGATLKSRHGSVERSWTLAEPVRRALVDLLGLQPQDRIAVYAPLQGTERIQVVVRTEAGWLIATDLRRGFDTPVTVEEATRRLRDLGVPRLVLGRPLADLDPIVRPLVPRLDKTCLPAVETLAQHLRPWTAEVRRTPDGAVLEERGLPLLNLVGFGAAALADRLPEPRALSGPTTEL